MNANTTSEPDNELTLEVILKAVERFSDDALNPFVKMLEREGFDQDDNVLMVIPQAWVDTELGMWLREPFLKPWMKLTPHVNLAYILDVNKVRSQLPYPYTPWLLKK